MPKFKHVIWDWNGTLLDDARLCYEIINEIAHSNGLQKITFERYLEIFTFPVKKYYESLGLPVDNGSFEKLGKLFIEEYERRKFETSLHENAKETLKKIRNLGIGQSILSAYSLDKLHAVLRFFELREYFTEIAGLDNIYAAGKVEIGKQLIKKLNLKQNEAVMIGDTLHDAEVAREIGAEIILVAHGHQSEDRLRRSGNKVVNSLDELIKFIN